MKTGIVILSVLVGVYFFYPEKSVTYGPGVMAPDDPVQSSVPDENARPMNGFELTNLAAYDITARILSTQDYSYGRESELSPIDLAVGWGRMSDESVLNQLKISQTGRWMNWRTKGKTLPIPQSEISQHSANMHMIPANSDVEAELMDLYKGQVVHLTGSLVRARAADGWRWTSSLSRTDKGGRACEVFYVESVTVVQGED